MKFKLLSPAFRELRDAYHYYEGKVPGLGGDFLSEVRAAIQRIVLHPHAWHSIDPNFRRCRTARFPFGIIYSVHEDEVLVVSVMNLHRRPASWRKNLE